MSLRVSIFPVLGLDSSVHSGLMFSCTNTLIFLSIHDTHQLSQMHHFFYLLAFLIIWVFSPQSPRNAIHQFHVGTKLVVSPPIMALSIAIHPNCNHIINSYTHLVGLLSKLESSPHHLCE